MKHFVASLHRGFVLFISSRTGQRVVPYVASSLIMAAWLTTLTLMPLGDSSFTVILVVLLACCWLGGLGPSIVVSTLVLAWLRISAYGFTEGLFDFSTKELLDV